MISNESLGSFLESLAGAAWRSKVLESPPDLFGLSAYALARTGAYLAVISRWPPAGYKDDEWQREVRRIGRRWADSWSTSQKEAPKEVRALWREIVKNSQLKLRRLYEVNYSDVALANGSAARRICRALLEIIAIADEACFGLGIPGDENYVVSGGLEDVIMYRLFNQYFAKPRERATMCEFINPEKLSVLPKLHTPQTGITIRSLSNNLALCFGGEVRVEWAWGQPLTGGPARHGLNVLVLPWPDHIGPTDFSSAKPRGGRLSAMTKADHGFFCFRPFGPRRWNLTRLRSILKQAKQKVGVIDALVLPELAVNEKELALIASEALKIRPLPPIIIAGVRKPHKADRVHNTSVTLIPFEHPQKKGTFRYGRFEQAKHHRWKLDSRQIEQYGLGGVLDPSWSWWENSSLPPRAVTFVSINPWLTLCTLLCEDLARPDPIADIVRAVGPNLVIALLMDGPQLASRWPARYGTVLADDPGSSVLTVTNLGMAQLSRARDNPTSISRVVALWKDSYCGAPIQITLPHDKQAVVLCLTRKKTRELTADGRHDEFAAAHLNLSGVHAV